MHRHLRVIRRVRLVVDSYYGLCVGRERVAGLAAGADYEVDCYAGYDGYDADAAYNTAYYSAYVVARAAGRRGAGYGRG